MLFLLCALVSFSDVARQIDSRVQDSYVRLQPKQASPDDIALVLIDDRSLQEYGRWPWSRELLAHLIRKVGEASPRAVGVDILLSEPQSETADHALADTLHAQSAAVLVAKIADFPDGPRWLEPLPMFARYAKVGHAQALLDADGVCRRFPVVQLTTEGPRYAFSVEVARRFSPEAVQRYLLEESVSEMPNVTMTIEKPSLTSIAYRRTDILTLSAVDVLHGRTHAELAGRAVLIGFGPTEISDRLTTPLGGTLPTPGVQIHAQILNSVLRNLHLRSISAWWSLAILLVLAPILLLGFRMVLGWKSPLVAVVLSACLYLCGYVIFRNASVSVSITPLITAAIFAPIIVYGADLGLAEKRLKSQVRDLQHWLSSDAAASTETETRDIFGHLAAVGDLQSELGSLYELHSKLLEATGDAVAVFDSEGALILRNEEFSRIFPRDGDPITLASVESSLRSSQGEETEQTHEALIGEKLYAVRVTSLASINLAKNGGTVVTLSSLQMRVERDRARSEALRFVTHELRTPIVAIQGFAELMLRVPDSQVCRNAPETIFRESQRLIVLINSYLDVLRIESGFATLRREQVNVNEVVGRTLELLSPLAQAAHMTLRFEDRQACSISGDKTLLTGAVLNLLSNAIKYGRSGTEVEIGLTCSESSVVLSVYNECVPLPEEELRALFDLNYRASANKLQTPGWGIGLAFVKRIAENHIGTVKAESVRNGIRFELRLPMESKGAAVAQL